MMNEESDFLLPILVNSMGRSGSTLVMSLLGGDERCVFDKIYPMESRYLSRIAQFAAEWNGWTFQRAGDGKLLLDKGLGMHPVLLRLGADPEQVLSIPPGRDILLSLWPMFGRAVLTARPHAKFYAEKTAPWVPPFLAQWMNLYAIYLFRDPRDLFLSANSMNSQRDYLSFGRTATDSDYDHAVTLAYRYLSYFESYRFFKRSNDMFSLVRYEDVARDPESVFANLTARTGLLPKPPAETDIKASHRTTRSVEDSIGRWKRESFSPEVMGVLEHVLGAALQELGYELSQDPSTRYDLGFDFLYGEPQEMRRMSFNQVETHSVSAGGLEIQGQGNSFEMIVKMPDTAAETVKEIWLSLSGDHGSTCELSWAGADGEFAPERSMTRVYDAGRHLNYVRMELDKHDLWHGTISHLRFKLSHDQRGPGFQSASLIRWLKVVPAEGQSDTQSNTEQKKPEGGFFQKLLRGV